MGPVPIVPLLLVILSSSLLQNAHAQSKSPQDNWKFVQSSENLSKAVANLENKINLQTSVLHSLITKEELESTLLNNNLATKSEMQRQEISLESLVKKADMDENTIKNIEAKVDVLLTLLTNLHATINEETKNSSLTKSLFDGIIAGNKAGIGVIPFDTPRIRIFSRGYATGVGYNRETRKVYWTSRYEGVKMADLDGSSMKLIIADKSDLCGLAVDEITGNFYYGVRGLEPKIRVCDRSGKKCGTVASGADLVGRYIYDIALSPAQGLMFWSSQDKKTVTRAHMDGLNATVIISEEMYGLDVDDFTQRLYWVSWSQQSVGYCDFNGNNRNVLLNVTRPSDVAVDGDTLYFGGDDCVNDYHCINSAHDGKVTMIDTADGSVNHITLYGGYKKVPTRSNPCANSPCVNLCVLTRFSYNCL